MALPAAADWVYRAPEASDDLGSAYVENAAGFRLDVGCGNGGSVSLGMSPNPGVQTLQGQVAMFGFSVDGGRPHLMPTQCSQSGCGQSLTADIKPWPTAEAAALTSALRGGSSVEILLGSTKLTQFTLAGSGAALGRLKATTPLCDGL
ncbi:hypothetical protein CX676_17795 [Paracoccus zhejiangensis]|uniref:Uncharacterized protein n=2 Tax=Paracoccus zhejiangensis TaxID=1077935 RepID=A0A2H5F2L2_9RHOB|nr:hypothetical protein CX676_17795 [Paracoccus zhejiangensis]